MSFILPTKHFAHCIIHPDYWVECQPQITSKMLDQGERHRTYTNRYRKGHSIVPRPGGNATVRRKPGPLRRKEYVNTGIDNAASGGLDDTPYQVAAEVTIYQRGMHMYSGRTAPRNRTDDSYDSSNDSAWWAQ